MKKIFVLICMLCMSCTNAISASDKKPHAASLDFTLNYRPDSSSPQNEHIMKNSVMLENKWVVAGKLQTAHNNQSLLFLVRMLSHKNNKYNLQFMLVDSDDKHTYITEPRLAAITGLPMKMSQQGDGKSIQLNALVKVVGKQPS